MAKYRQCERVGCSVEFDITDHKHQRFCSKSCAKIGTKHRHAGMVKEIGKGSLEYGLLLVKLGHSYREAAELSGVSYGTLNNHYKKLTGEK